MKKCLKKNTRRFIETVYTAGSRPVSGEKIYDILHMNKNLV